jgi:uncharacterized protein involved in exopolysaccharide biosynthesis
MSQAFEAHEYIDYLLAHWRSVLVTCLVAVAVAVIASLWLPKRYEATASILIDPPAGSDVRAATAVSPVYLESLRTYEHFADSDSLFQRAAERFHLVEPGGGMSVGGLKRRALRVSKLRDTRILQISVTLIEPKTAQALAQFLAEETVRMSQTLIRESESDLIEDARRQASVAEERMNSEQKVYTDFSSTASIDGLKAEVESLTQAFGDMTRDSLAADADVAEWTERAKSEKNSWSVDRAREELQATQAKAAALRAEKNAMEQRIQAKSDSLARAIARKEQLEAKVKEATMAYNAAAVRLQEIRSAASFRGERLKMIDPGVVPERPSFPNLPLNVIAAFAAGILIALVQLSVRFNYSRARRAAWRDDPIRVDR